MYPRRKTVESCFILFQMVVKLFLILKIKIKIILKIKWHNLEKLSKLLINILERPIKWKVVKIFAKRALKL